MRSRIESEFIPYQQALELKELGFDEPCFATYEFRKLFIGEFQNSLSFDLCKKTEVFPAPTFSQAFRWFREKYNVHSSPKRYDETKWWVEWGTWTSPVFETFEEAELAWLNKLIEIVKPMAQVTVDC